jgi:prevent-host-death family protein
MDNMRRIGVSEAKRKLGELLDIIERGEQVLITWHGKEAARLVPVEPRVNQSEAREVARRIREMSRGVTLCGLCVKDLVETGRP